MPVVVIDGMRSGLAYLCRVRSLDLPEAAHHELEMRLNSTYYPRPPRIARDLVRQFRLHSLAVVWPIKTGRGNSFQYNVKLPVMAYAAEDAVGVVIDDADAEAKNWYGRALERGCEETNRRTLLNRFLATLEQNCVWLVMSIVWWFTGFPAAAVGFLFLPFGVYQSLWFWCRSRKWRISDGKLKITILGRTWREIPIRRSVLIVTPVLALGFRHAFFWKAVVHGGGSRTSQVLSECECLMLVAAWRQASGVH